MSGRFAGPGSPARTVSSGVDGLDDVLGGGFPANHLYLVEGFPGAGKTTLALQFLLAGVQRSEPGLYVTLSETAQELRAVADSHGWSLDGITIYELAPAEVSLAAEDQYTLLHPAEVELGETTRAVLDEVERTGAARVVFDSLSELRLLSRDSLRFRRQVLGLKQFFVGRACTVILLDDRTVADNDLQLQSISHGVLVLEQLAFDYGSDRRRLRVQKLRGVRFRGGYHDYSIETGGMRVFPRLVASEHHEPFARSTVASGVAELDALLGGGLDRGGSVLLLGPAGTGKSTLATQYAVAAAERGERAAIYTFDESLETLLDRSTGLGIGLRGHVERGMVVVQQVDPAELSPGELVQRVRECVERDGCRVLVIDSLNGYLNAMPEERFLIIQLHELLSYLGQRGVLTILIAAQHGLMGEGMVSPIDVSYLADTVVLLRYFEASGAIRLAISVVKKRSGPHERTIREFGLGPGIRVGPPLTDFSGILSGIPDYHGTQAPLLEPDDARG